MGTTWGPFGDHLRPTWGTRGDHLGITWDLGTTWNPSWIATYIYGFAPHPLTWNNWCRKKLSCAVFRHNLYPILGDFLFLPLLKWYSTAPPPPDHSIRMRAFSPLCSSGDTRLKRSFPGRFRAGKGQVELLLDWTTKWLNKLYCFTDTIEQPHHSYLMRLKTFYHIS